MRRGSTTYFLKKLTFPLVFLASFAAAHGQADKLQKCPATIGDVPFLSRLALGMKPEQLSQLLGLPIKPEPKKTAVMVERSAADGLGTLGVSGKVKRELFAGETVFKYSNDPPKSILGVSGVQALAMEFYKDSLYSFSMFFRSPEFKWKDAAEFAALASEKLNLPKEYWRINPGVAAITCQSFHLTAYVSAENNLYLIFYNPAVSEEIQAEAKRLLNDQK